MRWLAFVLALAGCAEVAPPHVAPHPRPDRAAQPTAVSAEATVYYARLEAGQVAQGLMRTDRGGPDAPYDARDLATNFLRIAFWDEYAATGAEPVEGPRANRLYRWLEPVRFDVTFGRAVPEHAKPIVSGEVADYADELARASGHAVSVVPERGNFHVLILTEDERRGAGPLLRALVPGIRAADVAAITDLPQAQLCTVFAFSAPGVPIYTGAVAVIRAEHPDLMRRSCIDEELAQGMGLANDSPVARPSIFNDDEEFALLTTQDALMLRMLYDPRLIPGMTEADAQGTVEVIAAELLGGGT